MSELPQVIKHPIEHIDLVKYAGASGDFNEIHTIPIIANEKGYTNVIVHGMFLMGWGTQVIMEWFPHRKIHLFKVRFQAVTYPGIVLTIKGRWTDQGGGRENDNGEIEIIDQTGEIKLKGYFELKG